VAALKESGVTQAQADKLTPFLLGQMKAIQDQQMAAWADQTRQWRSDVENDAEIGKGNLRASLIAAALARDTYGSPEFKALLADPNLGIGNHPGVVRFLAAVGKAMGEDTREPGRSLAPSTNGATRDRSIDAVGSRMFPNSMPR
jgi:hypothetical protein